MFVGHYSVSLALKSRVKEAPLWALFLAVQVLDILFFPLALLGVEQLRIVPHFTGSTNFELPYMPYTHGLAGALVLSLVTGATAFLLLRQRSAQARTVALAIGAAVFSHWLLDLVVHTPDLPLLGNDSPKLGFGLWAHPYVTWGLEAVLLIATLMMYLRATRAITPAGNYAMPAFVGFLLLVNAANIFGPPPPGNSIVLLSVAALAAYLGFAAIAFWLERYRHAA